ncbi:MAG TPA: S41 family peptidase [Stellaceae bacterium]|nr:S41 family peptidase [Stellaceae bacterium]
MSQPLRGRAVRALAAGLILALVGCAGTQNAPGAGIGAGSSGGNGAAPVVTGNERQADLVLYNRVLDRVRASYVQPVSEDKLLANSLKGMLTGLDPHSDYLNESEYQDLLDESEGEFAGIGAEITHDESHPKVISPIDNTPAARAGLKPGDIILRIDGTITDGMNLKEVVDKLRGEPGTDVKITIARVGQKPFDVTITRAIIHVASVTSHLQTGNIAYLRIATFAENTQQELVHALDAMSHEAGGHLNGVVLDLRNDPGGLLESAVRVAGDFLDGGVVVATRGRDPEDNHIYDAMPNGDHVKGLPMVVLINGASASASEIVAGALKDRKRADILGTRSFGKGSVQTIIPLDGKGALRLTTALYYTPSGHSIQGEGIIPDEVILPPHGQRGAEGDIVHESDLSGALHNPGKVAALENSPEANIDPMLIGTPKDYQLSVAIEHLKAASAHHAANAVQSPAPGSH